MSKLIPSLQGYKEIANSGNSTIDPSSPKSTGSDPANEINLLGFNTFNKKPNTTQKAKVPNNPFNMFNATPSSGSSAFAVTNGTFRGRNGPIVYPKKNLSTLHGNFMSPNGKQMRVSGNSYNATFKAMKNAYKQQKNVIAKKEAEIASLKKNIKQKEIEVIEQRKKTMNESKKAKNLYLATLAQQKEAERQQIEAIKRQRAQTKATLKKELGTQNLATRLGLRKLPLTPKEEELARQKAALAAATPRKKLFGLFGGKKSTRRNRRATRKNTRKNRRNTRRN